MNALVAAEHLAFAYPGREVLRDVSLQLRPGRIVALLGPNGCGKSTLLRLLLGLLRPTAGAVRIAGESVARLSAALLAQRLAYVPQQTAARFAFTAAEVVAMGRASRHPLGFFGIGRDRRLARVALARLGAEALADRVFATLSGGERQLVVLARALAQEAPALLLDEPVTGLDYGHQLRLLELVTTLAQAEGRAVLFTTHTPEHVLAVADEVVLLRSGEVMRRGAPTEVLTAETLAELYMLEPERVREHWRRTAFPAVTDAELVSEP